MPKHLSDDLAHASFGELAGNNNDLSSSMSRVLIARDANAPLYITQDHQANFEKRRDISTLRQLHAKAKVHEPKMVSAIYHRIEYILFRLNALQLAVLRKEYFMYVDRMRAEGKQTQQIRHPDYSSTKCARPSRGNSDWQTASCIGMLLRQDTKPDVAIQKLIGYLTNKPIKNIFPEAKDSNRAKSDFTCLFCSKRYRSKFNLNRHFQQYHLRALNKGFPCPECLRGGIMSPVNASPEAWSSHVARFHDKGNAPNLKLQFKVEDNVHMKETCTGKRSRPISLDSLHEPSKKLRYDPDQKPKILHEDKEEIFCIKKEEEEEAFDFKEYFLDDEEERSNHDPHNGEEFYVSGRDDLDE